MKFNKALIGLFSFLCLLLISCNNSTEEDLQNIIEENEHLIIYISDGGCLFCQKAKDIKLVTSIFQSNKVKNNFKRILIKKGKLEFDKNNFDHVYTFQSWDDKNIKYLNENFSLYIRSTPSLILVNFEEKQYFRGLSRLKGFNNNINNLNIN